MPTARFCDLIGVPERTWRRWQARQRGERPPRGPWPRPVRTMVRTVVIGHAKAHPAWGHRKVWAMARHQGIAVSMSTVLRLLRDDDLLLTADYQRDRRQLTAARKAAFCAPPTGPNQVWQLDFSEFETTRGGVWRIAGCADYWSKYEFGWHISPTANQHDAIAAVETALGEAARLAEASLLDTVTDRLMGEVRPVVIVTDNGGPFRSARFERFITAHPELDHVRTRVRSPGQNGVRERGFESMKYERLYFEEIDDGLALAAHAEAYRIEYNTIRPHEALSWNRPLDVHAGRAQPGILTFPEPETLPPS